MTEKKENGKRLTKKKMSNVGQIKKTRTIRIRKGGYDVNTNNTSYDPFIFFVQKVIHELLRKISFENFTFVEYFANTFCKYTDFLDEVQRYLVSSEYFEKIYNQKVEEYLSENSEHEFFYEVLKQNMDIVNTFLLNIFENANWNQQFVKIIQTSINQKQFGGKKKRTPVKNKHKIFGGEPNFTCMTNAFVRPLVATIDNENLEHILQTVSQNSLLMKTLMDNEMIYFIVENIYRNHLNIDKLQLVENFTNNNKNILNNIFQSLQTIDRNLIRSEIKNGLRTLIEPEHQRSLKSNATRFSRAVVDVFKNPMGNNVISLGLQVEKLKPHVNKLMEDFARIDNNMSNMSIETGFI